MCLQNVAMAIPGMAEFHESFTERSREWRSNLETSVRRWFDNAISNNEQIYDCLPPGILSLSSFSESTLSHDKYGESLMQRSLPGNKAESPQSACSASGSASMRHSDNIVDAPQPVVPEEVQEVMKALTGNMEGRLDYVLQDAPLELKYFSMANAHFGYYCNSDSSLFILMKMLDIEDDRLLTRQASNTMESSKA